MFKYTNHSDEITQRSKSPKDRTRSPSISNRIQGVEKHNLGSFPAPKPKTMTRAATPQKDKTISERYTNSTYNRLLSPKGRFQAISSPVTNNRPPSIVRRPSTLGQQQTKPSGKPWDRVQEFSSRAIPGSQTNTSSVKLSCSDIVNRRRSLEAECKKGNIRGEVDVRVRPKTSQCTRTESRLENKVLHRVESVLSRAVMQQGKIDETNIANIINSMRSSLYQDEDLDDEDVLSEIEVDPKPSRTTVNEINTPEEYPVEKNVKHVTGIVRKDNSSSKPERKPYRKIYDQSESSTQTQTMNKNVPDGDEETLLYVDLSDVTIPNFSSSKKNDRKYSPKPTNETSASKQNSQIDTSKRNGLLQQFEVGDFQSKESRFWNSSEDEKLRGYVESLIQNIKGQMHSENSAAETEGEIDSQGTVCRSFCVCKVCVSKNPQSKPVLKVEGRKTKPLESTVGRIVRNAEKPPIKVGDSNRLRLLKPSSKCVEANAPCKVIRKTNPNFKPDQSSLNTSLHMTPINKTSSYTVVVDAATSHEEGDDMYLQRRIRKAPGKWTSAKMK